MIALEIVDWLIEGHKSCMRVADEEGASGSVKHSQFMIDKLNSVSDRLKFLEAEVARLKEKVATV